MSGIFRDVYILSRPQGHLHDYKITTDLDGEDGLIEIQCDKPVKVRLCDGGKKLQEQKGESLSFRISHAKPWTAETPHLYTLLLSYKGEWIREEVGIRHIEIRNGIFTLNGKPFKMKGVNRHSMTVQGYVESYELMEQDIRLFKENNINAVRTSHYPPHPYFLQLCDRNGIYVIDEADLETHGLGSIHYNGSDENWNDLANSEQYLNVYLHRQARMYERDKNRQCILIWSLGNEAGWGENFKACIRYLHSVDSRPLHYEGCRNLTDTVWKDVELLDVASCMYASPQECLERLDAVKMPFMLCEYTHAMGNSCGDIKAYWDIIYSHDAFFGAFVWEWCNHSVLTQEKKALFGGDFGEKEPVHSSEGNFCMDGLVDIDRRPHPSLGEVRQVYAPVDVYGDSKTFTLVNRRDFCNLDDLHCVAVKKVLGVETQRKDIDLSHIGAREKKTFVMPFGAESAYTTVDFLFCRQDGTVCACRQIILCDAYSLKPQQGTGRISRRGERLFLEGDSFRTVLDRQGMISRIVQGGKNVLRAPMRLQLYRALIDNDGPFWYEWESCRLPYAAPFATQVRVDENRVCVYGKIVANSVEPLYDYKLNYAAYANKLQVTFEATKHDWVKHVPRIGFAFELPDAYGDVSFFGRGADEAYEDRKLNCPVGLYNGNVKTLNFAYGKAQESGSHCNSRMVSLSDKEGAKFVVESDHDFSFSVSPYSYKDYKRHSFEMPVKTGKTVLSVDYRMAGVGSAACGPALDPKFRVSDQQVKLAFDIHF